MSILSNSIYGSPVGKGVGGLLSGLDTDDLVNQMTAMTRNKINRQYQAKQKLLYRQEAYREVSTKLLSFSNKYFSYSTGSKTNILSPGFFEAYTYSSSSNYVNITGDASSIKNFEIRNIDQVASAASFSATNEVSSQQFSTYNEIPDEISRLAGETFSITTEEGKTYTFSIGKDFKNKEQTLDNVSKELNDQLKSITDKDGKSVISEDVKFEFSGGGVLTLSGGAYLSAGSSEFLDVLKMKTGEEDGKSSTEFISKDDLIRGQSDILSNVKNEEYIAFDYNGSVKKIGLGSGIYNIKELSEHLQTQLNKEFGDGKVLVNYDENNPKKISFSTSEDNNVLKINSISRDLNKLTGLQSGDINRVKKDAAIGDSGISNLQAGEDGKYSITINDKTLEFEKTATFNDIVKAINNDKDMNVTVKYSTTTDKFSIAANETGAHTGINIKYDGEGNLANALFGIKSDLKETGTNTKMTYTLNGSEPITIERNSANFTIDDISLDLNKNAEGLGKDGIPVTFDVINNVDDVVERVKDFINEYNEIITLIGTGTAQRPKRDYPPLTPDQMDEMKEQEIKDWTAEAKKGMIYSDPKMMRVLSDLRGAMGGTTDTSSLTLAQIGISPAYMDTTGKLVMDENKFKQKLLESPEEIANLFSGALSGEGTTSGIASQLKDILVKNVGVSGTSGVLVEEAGMSLGLTADKNYISEKIKDYDGKMEELKKALQDERQRCWNKFAALEQSLNQLNAQSSWLTDMMGN